VYCSPLFAAESTLHVGQAKLVVNINGKARKLENKDIIQWVKNSARAVESYYGHFPVNRLRVDVVISAGQGIQTGKAFGISGPLIRVGIGRDSRLFHLNNDWVMTHEMVHLAFPGLSEQHGWLLEGMATYIEPIARYHIGQYSEKQVWIDLVENLPKGLPKAGDRGLDNTHSWGRTYWGGALFCLLADIQIHQKTNNEKGLRDALVAINNKGGDITQSWDIVDALSLGDKETGTTVLTDLYHQMKSLPVDVDLAGYWKQLGIKYNNGTIKFNDNASLAEIRKKITRRF